MVIGSIANEERTKGLTILLGKKQHDEAMSKLVGVGGWGSPLSFFVVADGDGVFLIVFV